MVAWLGALVATTGAQPSPSAQPAAPTVQAGGQTLKLEDLPPAVRLGVRAETVRRGWPTLPIVVLVPDGGSYLEALSTWRATARFPVLIDDGTTQAREDAARFVRAFKPQRVVRWSGSVPLLPEREARRSAIESAIYRSWGAMLPGENAGAPLTTMGELIARWQRLRVVPPGLIVADPEDDAWPAAVALSIGRMQPIVWIAHDKGLGGVGGTLNAGQHASLDAAISAGAAATGIPYLGVGEGLDAVTLCTHTPGKTQFASDRIFATTDLLCRDGTHTPEAPEKGARWAWVGQIFGTPPRAAYQAMCSLFLGTNTAWLFDGYPDTKPWNEWDATETGQVLKKGGFDSVVVADTPRQGAHHWRLACASGIDAGFVGVTTKGMPDEFDLEPGQCRPGDVPMLRVPAMVYFVHSFSAATPDARGTIAARWLERGAYAYLGSVHEPFLQSFPPTPKVAARLLSGYPFAAAVRFDDGPAWRLATFGDPLACIGPAPGPPQERFLRQGLALEGVRGVGDDFKEALAARDFQRALEDLTLLGRDDDAGKLAVAILADASTTLAPGAAGAAITALQRTNRPRDLVRAYALLTKDRASDPILRDALWQAAYPEIHEGSDEALVKVLAANLRDDQAGQDASVLAPAMARAMGRDAALEMLRDARARSRSELDRTRADEASKRLAARGGR